MKQIHRINGQVVNPPSNYEELELSINYDNDNPNRTINVTRFDWRFEEWAIIKAISDAGLTGGPGVFEGIPHSIEIQENGSSFTLLDGYIDLKTATFGENQVQVDSVPRAQIDWLNDVAEGFTFEYLKEVGIIDPETDYKFMPYVLDSVPNYKEAFIIQMTLTFVGIEFQRVVKELTADGGKLATLVDTPSGVINLIANALYLIALFVTIIDLILDMIQLIIQPLKYKPMMSIKKHIDRACEYLGITYSSPLLDAEPYNRLYVIPESFNNPEQQSDDRILGFLSPDEDEQNGYFNGTFADLLRAIKDMFNARIRIEGKELQILPSLKTLNSATFKLPDYDVDSFEYNASNIVGTYLISYSYDTTEKQTIQNWRGNNYQVVLSAPNTSGDKDLRLISGLNRITIPFARAIRKESLTTPEKVADAVLNVLGAVVDVVVTVINGAIDGLNAAIKAVNKLKNALKTIGIKIKAEFNEVNKLENPGLGDLIDDRVGTMLLETDIITVPKITIVREGTTSRKNKVSSENETHLKAGQLYELHHYVNSFAPNSKNAQRIVWKFEKVEMNLAEVQAVESEGVVRMPSGNIAEVIEMNYNPSTRLCNFVVHERRIYTNNLKEVKIEPVGR